MVGFSFSPKLALAEGEEPIFALQTLLTQLQPDLVRLPIYWDTVAPDPKTLDFSQTDRLLEVLQTYDRSHPLHPVAVVLVVGARNLGNPEVHLPAWAADGESRLRSLLDRPEYRAYLEAAFARYAGSPLLYGWQVENEPLDNTNPWLGDVSLPAAQVAKEVELLRSFDPDHPVVVTTYDSSTASLDRRAFSPFWWLWDHLPGPRPAGHPLPALQLGDALGLDAYVVTPNTPLREASASTRIAWKRDALEYWWERAQGVNKQLWITEMQAAPWDGRPGFTTADLLESARAYRTSGASVVLLWGVESWLRSPSWMRSGRLAVRLLRGLA